MPMDIRDLHDSLVEGIDKVLGMSRLFGPSEKMRAILRGVRRLVEIDQSVLEKLAPLVGPYGEPKGEQDMAHDVKGIDWQAWLEKVKVLADNAPAIVVTILRLVDLFYTKQRAGVSPDCCPELREKCEKECDALLALIEAHCELHDAICMDDKPA